MPGFTRSFLFPDINVWVALTYERHVHHDVAADWFESLDGNARLHFCRHTQLGLLRLLTSEAVMSDEVMTQKGAWFLYDRWQADDRVGFADEPPELEHRFRALSRRNQSSPKAWAGAYLAAFAAASQMTLVTFDRSFRGQAPAMILLGDNAS